MSAADKQPAKGAEGQAALDADKDARIAELEAKLAAATAKLADRAVVKAVPAGRLFAKCRIVHGDVVIEAGAPLPFDPRDEDAAKKGGYSGLREGEHFELAR